MSDSNKDDRRSEPEGPTGPSASELLDAALGWNVRFFGTMWASLVNPVDVARAALSSDTSRYVSALRLFIFLYGLLMALSALIGGAAVPGVEAISGAGPQTFERWLGDSGHALNDIEARLGFWSSIVIWPITAISSAFYILLFKAYAPKRTFYGHLLIYLITNNGAVGVQLVLMVMLSLFVELAFVSVISTTVLLITYLFITGRVISALYARTVLGTVFKLLGVVAVLPVSLIISGTLQFLFIEVFLQVAYDLSLFQLMAIEAGAAP